MENKVWFISDTHFHHKNILTFLDKNGQLIRPEFHTIEQMNEYMIEAWNSVVSKEDTVYHLGDVLFGSSWAKFEILHKLNGKKILIKGNHDNANIQKYLLYFSDIKSELYKITPEGDIVIFTHRPILFDGSNKESSIITFNVHGHLHQNNIDDFRYINVSVEQLKNYKPIDWKGIIDIINTRKNILKG